jgi:hypothetical protein
MRKSVSPPTNACQFPFAAVVLTGVLVVYGVMFTVNQVAPLSNCPARPALPSTFL